MAVTDQRAAPSVARPFSLRLRLRRELGLAAIVGLALVYALNAWTPSHYGEALRLLGVPHAGLVAGSSNPVRSDEWAVGTPLFQIAVANHFGPTNETSPYREALKSFAALPSRDWGMLFKPDLWGFLVLDPAHAFSLHYAVLAATMLIGFALLLRQFGVAPAFALAVSAVLFLSQFVQAWWSSHGATFAFAPWVLAAYLWRAPWFVRLPALAYAVAVWLISFLYPPFIIAAASAFVVLLIAFRRDALRPGRLLPSLAAAGAGVAAAWLNFADLIPIMRATVYPGQRLSDGGGVPAAWLAAHIFPYLTTSGFEPLPRWATNACEIAVAGSFLPLAFTVFTDHPALLRWSRTHRWTLGIWLAGLALMLAWMALPIPARFAPGWNLVPPGRMVWGFGLLLTLGLAVVADQLPWIVNARRTGIFLLLAAGGWGLSKLALSSGPSPWLSFDLVILPVLATLLLIVATAARGRAFSRRTVMLAVVVTSALTFGRFNPVQSAAPIFQRQESPTLDAFRAYAAANPRGWLVAPGGYGAVLNGAGVRAINHTLMRPQVAFFRTVFPELGEAELNQTFNRYAHIVPTAVWRPAVLQQDVIAVPPDRLAIPLRADLETGDPAHGPRPAGALDRIELTRLGVNRWGVAGTGWGLWSGVNPEQRLRVTLSDRLKGRVVRVSAFRLPRPDVAAALHDPSLFAAGFGVRVLIEADRPPTGLAPDALVLTSIDPSLGVHVIGSAAAKAASPGIR